MQSGDHVIALADSYIWVIVVGNIISVVNEANMDLFEMMEQAQYANTMYFVRSLVHIRLVALFAFIAECDLVMMCLLMGAVALFTVSACDPCRVAQLCTECWNL